MWPKCPGKLGEASPALFKQSHDGTRGQAYASISNTSLFLTGYPLLWNGVTYVQMENGKISLSTTGQNFEATLEVYLCSGNGMAYSLSISL